MKINYKDYWYKDTQTGLMLVDMKAWRLQFKSNL